MEKIAYQRIVAYQKVLKELRRTIFVEEPCTYAIEKRIVGSIILRSYYCISFFKGSYAHQQIDKHYWKQVDYHFFEKEKFGRTLVWFEFQGKHMQLVN